jgi:isoleucyl-tRNA synthetase
MSNKDYKDSLNLPKTDFPMKANLPQREPDLLKSWYESGIYSRLADKSKGRPKYILHDGPPYANGDIHIGHALNKTLKDIIVKYKTMRGFDSAYVPGWDCHGLPVEHALFKELRINKYQINQAEFRKKAFDYAMKFVNIQKEQFKRLGVFGDWDNPYLTLDKSYEESIVRSFGELVEKGYIYRGLKPVNWCYRCETALAEAEVEYEDRISPSIYVKFKIDDAKHFEKDSYLVIWTTTPWTLIANVAVAVHPELIYAYIRTDKGNLIIAQELLDKALANIGIKDYKIIKNFKGKELEGIIYDHPFLIRKGRIVLAEYVSRDDGTGLVHTACGHGNDDYFTGVKYKLEILMPVDTKGNFDESAGEFKGINVHEADKAILEKLTGSSALLFDSKIQHSYPHCWRCKNPVIFRATEQWFLSIDKGGLRKDLLKAVNDVTWVPEGGKGRISAMIELRPDWCLSRQRYWGVPIPALRCLSCNKEFLDKGVIDNFAKIVSKEGSDTWFIRDVSEFLPRGLICPHCGTDKFVKGADILDVWFDSGVSHQAVLKKRKELGGTPCALYLEGSDQHRGWFQSSIIPSMAIDGIPPYKTVLTHGHVVDSEGRKMSKSLGNVISPQEVIKELGADILRLWVASSDYNEDIRISKEMLTRLSEAYRKIRNTFRFILSNLYDFDPRKDRVSIDKFRTIDKWIYRLIAELVLETEAAYDLFSFYRVYKLIYDFCNEKLSMYYLDMVKGRLYTYAADSSERRAAQTVMYDTLVALVKMVAPILTFTSEETWKIMPKGEESIGSVHFSDWPTFAQLDNPVPDEFEDAINMIPDIAKILEELRTKGEIGSSFDARIILLTKDDFRLTFLTSLKAELCEIYKVSLVEVIKVDKLQGRGVRSLSTPDIEIVAEKANGVKCVRCWNYSGTVGKSEEHPLICENCLGAVLGGRNK